MSGLNGCLKKPVNTRGVNIQFTTKNGMSWLKNVLKNSRKQWKNKLW